MRSLLHYLIVLIIKASGEDQISNGTNLKVGSKPKPVASTTVRSKPMQVAPTYVRIKPKPVASTTVKSEPWPDASTTERSELGPDVSNYAKIKLKVVASTTEGILPVPVASTSIRILPVSVASTNDNLPNNARDVILGKRILVSDESNESKKKINTATKEPVVKYLCSYCDVYFISRQKLLEHEQIHEKLCQESFSCSVCNETFNSKHILFNHEKSHTIYKTFTCELCNKVFNNEYAHASHKKSVHKDFMKEKESFNNFVNVNENISDNHAIKTDEVDEIKEEIDIEAVETIGEDPLTVPEEEESYGYGQSFIVFHEM